MPSLHFNNGSASGDQDLYQAPPSPPSFESRFFSVTGDEAATKWTPNESSTDCFICTKSFGLFRRKHHCRCCGGLVCSKCSPDKHYVAGYKDQRVRVCKNCSLMRAKRQLELKEQKVFISANNPQPRPMIVRIKSK